MIEFIGAYDDSEPRDERGRWTDGGGGFGSDADFVATPADALISLANGENATVSAEDARGVVERAADQGAGPIDLTNLTIENTPIFAGGLGRARDTMPQIAKEHQEHFLETMDHKGVDVSYESVRPGSLLPTQNEIDAVRVGQKLQEYDRGNKDLRPVMISRDNYVLDGHHRWATMAIVDVESPKLKVKMPVIRLGADHTKALRLMLEYTKKQGIANRALLEFIGAAGPTRYRLSKFAKQHAAELVDAPKRVRDVIRSEVAKALKNGEGPKGIADRLFGEVDMDAARIDTIARTEYVIAKTGATLDAADESDNKTWQLGDGEEGCPICQELEGETVGVDEQFETSDGQSIDGPPAHPNCYCGIAINAKRKMKAALRFIGAGDVEGHPFHGNQWTAGSPSQQEATDFLKGQLDKFGGLAKADAMIWAFGPHDAYRDRLIESFKSHLDEFHAALEKQYGKTVTVYRAEHSGDTSTGVRSFSLSKAGAEEFLGQNYRQGTSDKLLSGRVPVTSILAIGSTYSGEVLVDSTHIKGLEK